MSRKGLAGEVLALATVAFVIVIGAVLFAYVCSYQNPIGPTPPNAACNDMSSIFDPTHLLIGVLVIVLGAVLWLLAVGEGGGSGGGEV